MGVSTTNEWPQIDERMVLMPGNHMGYNNHHGLSATTTTNGANSISAASNAAGRVTGAAQQALKCPRCDSCNTKFCYYNNYSLTQPRHFCKACKRYWTRGGTLRNVPVGGGCRKNKRVKRHSSSSTTTSATATTMASDPPSFPNQITTLSLPPSSSCAIDPILYGLHSNSTDIDFPSSFPSFLKRLEQTSANSRIENNYDLNPHLSSMGLCFPMNTTAPTHQDFSCNLQFQQTDSASAAVPSTSLFHDFSLLGSSFTSSAAASVIATSVRQTKMGLNSPGWTASYDDIQAAVASGADLRVFNGVKEEDRNHDGGLDWQIPRDNNLFENINAVEGNSLYWNVNASGIGNGWAEAAATNCGSSITPLK